MYKRSFLLLVSSICLPFGYVLRSESVLTILYTGSDNGIIRSCQCPSNPWGGYAKKAWLINELCVVAGVDNTLKLHTGDIFAVSRDEKSDYLMHKLICQENYDFVAVGDMEIDCSLIWLPSVGYPGDIPWLCSANAKRILPQKIGKKIPSWFVFQRGGYHVGIVTCFSQNTKKRFVSATDEEKENYFRESVGDFILKKAAKLDLVIVLSHQGFENDKLLAKTIEGIDLIVSGHCQSLINPPEMVNGTAIVQAGKNGENLGCLLLTKKEEKYFNYNYLKVKAENNSQHSIVDHGGCFSPAFVTTPRWKIAHEIIPLNYFVDEDENIAKEIIKYENKNDLDYFSMLNPDNTISVKEGSRLSFDIPFSFIKIKRGGRKEIQVKINNIGVEVLKIKKIRSKNRCLTVVEWPKEIAPGMYAFLRFELEADRIDKFFRTEFSVTSNDSLFPVVKGVIKGIATGDIFDGLAPRILWNDLFSSLTNSSCEMAPFYPLLVEDNVQKPPLLKSRRILVEYFHSPGCEECQIVDENVIPRCEDLFGDLILIEKKDITKAKNFDRFICLSKKLKVKPKSTLSIFVDEEVPFLGIKNITNNLFDVIRAKIAKEK